MFFLAYTLLASIDHFLVNNNRIYMALIMTAPMIITMLLVLRKMVMNHQQNMLLNAGSAARFYSRKAGV